MSIIRKNYAGLLFFRLLLSVEFYEDKKQVYSELNPPKINFKTLTQLC